MVLQPARNYTKKVNVPLVNYQNVKQVFLFFIFSTPSKGGWGKKIVISIFFRIFVIDSWEKSRSFKTV